MRTLVQHAIVLVVVATVLSTFCLVPVRAAPPEADKPKTAAAESRDAKAPRNTEKKGPRTLGIVLYPKFELLDVYGPAEIFGNLPGKLKVVMVAQESGEVVSAQGPKVVADYGFDDCPPLDLVMVPGGFGTMTELKNEALLEWLRGRAENAEIVMSVCSGSALLAKAGLLDGRRATSNKRYFQIAVAQGPSVDWVYKARWVDDGNRVTSSGVSAGIDMALHVVGRLFGTKTAEYLADQTEYQWHRDADNDPFAKTEQ